MKRARRIPLLAGVAAFSLLVTAAADPGPPAPSFDEPVAGPFVSPFTAQVTGGGLRVRAFPRVDAQIITKLAAGDQVRVASRTPWTDTIDGITAPWYEVSRGWAAGWCFGGYLAPQQDETDIPKSPAARNEQAPRHAFFTNADGKAAPPLPWLDMKIFGIETPSRIPSRDGFRAVFDEINDHVFLELSAVPQRVLHVDAADPSGAAWSCDLRREADPMFFTLDQNEEGFTYAHPVIGFRFRAPADARAGAWNFRAVPDGKPSAAVRFRLDIGTASATLSREKRPDPFRYPSTVSARAGDLLYLFGAAAPPGARLTIALYRITDHQNQDLSFKLKPCAAAQVLVGKSGRYQATLHVGSDLSPGAYKLATGVSNMEINLFDVYLEVE